MSEKRGLKALEEWCRRVTQGHKDVSIRNMTTSWRDGLAFCAIIHHYCPELINYDALSKENIYQNNDTAFSVAEKELGIPALLEAADMVECVEPDPLSIATYLSQLYQYFEGKDGAPAPIVVLPKLPPDLAPKLPGKRLYNQANPEIPRVHQTCQSCGNRVFILERLIVDNKLYHRTCFSCHRCQALLQPGAYVEGDVPGTYECVVCPADEKVVPRRSPSLSSSSSASLSSLDDDSRSFESAASQDAKSNSSPRLPRISQDNVDLPKSALAGLELAQSVIKDSHSAEEENGEVAEEDKLEERRPSDEVELSKLISKPPLPSKPTFLLTKNRFGSLEKSKSVEVPIASPDNQTPEVKDGEIYSHPYRPPRLKTTLKRKDTLSSPERLEDASPPRSPRKLPMADIPLIFSPTYQLKPRPELNRVQSENSLSGSADERHLVAGDSRETEQALQLPSKPLPLRHTSLTDMSVLRKEKLRPLSNKLAETPQATEVPPLPSESKATDSAKTAASPEQKASSGDHPTPEIEQQPPAEKESPQETTTPPLPKEEMKPSESYPEDLNPFEDEEEAIKEQPEPKQESYPDELNPFGDDEEEEAGNKQPAPPPVHRTPERPKIKAPTSDYDSSLNPFGSDEEEEQASTPQPPKTPLSKGLSVNSPTGSIRSNISSAPGTLKKRRAPLPPPMKSESPTIKPQPQTPEDSPAVKSHTPEWKKKKRPAPPVPIPPRRSIKKIPVEEIHREMEEINSRLKELEKQGRDLETRIRDKPRTEEPSPEDEDSIDTFFELMNEKNTLFRRQAELMYIKRYQRLEEEQVELEHQLRCIMNKPRAQKTEEDLRKEDELLQRFLEVVEQRNEVVESIDLDRKRFQEDQKLMPSREAQEELIISERLEHRSAAAESKKDKKEKKKKKKKKDKAPKEKKEGSGAKLKKKWLGVI